MTRPDPLGRLVEQLQRLPGIGAKSVDVLQSYENFTGGVLMSLVEHDFFTAEEANDFLTLDNLLAPGGRLPLPLLQPPWQDHRLQNPDAPASSAACNCVRRMNRGKEENFQV